MKRYNRIMLGRGGKYADICYKDGYIGTDFGIKQDLTGKLPDEWRLFNKEFIPIYLQENPEKTRVAAGLACGMLWTICKGLKIGDVILCPNGNREYFVGTIAGNYFYDPSKPIFHCRKVQWMQKTISRDAMSSELQNSTASTGTCCDITKYALEIEQLINSQVTVISCSNEDVEDPSVFALEKHLEDFLVQNWSNTPLAKDYDIYEDNGELVGQQYQTDTGPIDILAISKDKKTILVIELKKGRTSDVVVGQIHRYMGYVKEELAEPNQVVKGMIIGLEADTRLKRALSVTTNIEFYRYVIDFKLHKGI